MNMTTDFLLYLASQSQRRQEILQQFGLPFRAIAFDMDESLQTNETGVAAVTRLALQKAHLGWQDPQRLLNKPVLGADTLVECDGQVMGKPADAQTAMIMLQTLSGKTHHVFTAVAMVQDARERVYCSTSAVTFRTLSTEEIQTYWQTGEPRGKAGAYAIQGLAGFWVREIQGSYTGIVGLPLFELGLLLAEFGLPFGTLVQQSRGVKLNRVE